MSLTQLAVGSFATGFAPVREDSTSVGCEQEPFRWFVE